MKELLTPKNIFIALIALYCVVTVERFLSMEDNQTAEIIQHEREKAQMNEDNQRLKNQIHNYEIKMLQKHSSIDTMSNDVVDAEWSNVFR